MVGRACRVVETAEKTGGPLRAALAPVGAVTQIVIVVEVRNNVDKVQLVLPCSTYGIEWRIR